VIAKEINGLTLDVSDYSPNLRMKSHAHEPVAFSFVLQGGYDESLGREFSRTCKQGMLVFHPSDETHSVRFHNIATKIFRVSVNSAWLERFRYASFELKRPAMFEHESITSFAKKMYVEFCVPDRFSEFAIEGLTLELLAATARSLSDKKENNTPRWLEEVREMLSENYSDETSLQTLAETAGVHPVYLARQFRKFYQTTVGDYVRQMRIEKASYQLSNTKQSISEIALATGFYDQSHFSNVFKRHTGMTPAEFRIHKRPC
jgi:AraC-like DNA-binding protein